MSALCETTNNDYVTAAPINEARERLLPLIDLSAAYANKIFGRTKRELTVRALPTLRLQPYIDTTRDPRLKPAHAPASAPAFQQ